MKTPEPITEEQFAEIEANAAKVREVVAETEVEPGALDRPEVRATVEEDARFRLVDRLQRLAGRLVEHASLVPAGGDPNLNRYHLRVYVSPTNDVPALLAEIRRLREENRASAMEEAGGPDEDSAALVDVGAILSRYSSGIQPDAQSALREIALTVGIYPESWDAAVERMGQRGR